MATSKRARSPHRQVPYTAAHHLPTKLRKSLIRHRMQKPPMLHQLQLRERCQLLCVPMPAPAAPVDRPRQRSLLEAGSGSPLDEA